MRAHPPRLEPIGRRRRRCDRAPSASARSKPPSVSTRPLSCAAAPVHTRAAGEGADRVDVALPALGDDGEEALVERVELAIHRGALGLVEPVEGRRHEAAIAALERVDVHAELLDERRDDEPRRDDADRAGDRLGPRDDLVRARGDVVAAARRDVRHVRDDGLHLGEAQDLVVDAIGRDRAAAGRVDEQDDALHAAVGARRAHGGDEAILRRERADREALLADDGPSHLDHADGRGPAERLQAARQARAEVGVDLDEAERRGDLELELVFVRGAVDDAELGRGLRRVRALVDPADDLVALHAAALRDGSGERVEARVEDRADLLLVGLAHLVAREHVAGALVAAAREDLGLGTPARSSARRR